MLREEIEEQLVEHLVNRIEEANTFILRKIGNAIKTISILTPSQAYQIAQILKYGGSYEEIVKELAKVSGKNVQDIYKIFEEVAKDNKEFAKQFYTYRGLDYIPYSKDRALQNQVESIARLTADTYKNITNTTGIGLLFEDINGQMSFKNIQQGYYEIIDRGILAISQGKESYQEQMRNIIKQVGNNGVVLYDSGRTRRLDSAVRMNLLDGLRQLNNETSQRFGQEYGADGIEISVHSNPAPDHTDIQGRQFSIEEYEKLQDGDIAKDYKGVKRYIEHSKSGSYRRISECNCYHKTFNVVLGVSEPEYTDKELEKIQKENEKGFEFEGKKYTMYEGTQLQRRIETEIRRQKDTQILAKESGDKELVQKCELKITQLLNKYQALNKASGLKPKADRLNVVGYRRNK